MTKQVCVAVLFALVVVFSANNGILLAHHSKAHYETGDKAQLFKGVVVQYQWRNPHVYVVWDVKDDSGKLVRWTGELSSVTTSIADGLTKSSLKPGDEVAVLASPSKTGAAESLIYKITKDGKVILDLTHENIRSADR